LLAAQVPLVAVAAWRVARRAAEPFEPEAEWSWAVALMAAQMAPVAPASEPVVFPDVEKVAASAQEGVQRSQRTRPARQRIDARNSL